MNAGEIVGTVIGSVLGAGLLGALVWNSYSKSSSYTDPFASPITLRREGDFSFMTFTPDSEVAMLTDAFQAVQQFNAWKTLCYGTSSAVTDRIVARMRYDYDQWATNWDYNQAPYGPPTARKTLAKLRKIACRGWINYQYDYYEEHKHLFENENKHEYNASRAENIPVGSFMFIANPILRAQFEDGYRALYESNVSKAVCQGGEYGAVYTPYEERVKQYMRFDYSNIVTDLSNTGPKGLPRTQGQIVDALKTLLCKGWKPFVVQLLDSF